MIFALASGLAWMGCQSGAGSSSEPVEPPVDHPTAAPAGRVVAGPEQRLLTAMDRAHFAFRAASHGFRAGHATHDVTVDAGAIRLVPRHHTEDGVVTGDPLALETRAIGRGEEMVPVAKGASAVDGETGDLTIVRGEAVERLANFDAGLEQSWAFANEPTGDGDLQVEVAVSGHAFAGATASGLHFVTPGRLGFRYGHATWVDAEGAATRVATTYADGTIKIKVPADLLAQSVYPAVLDPTIGPEIAVDSPVIGWTGGLANHSSIASDGSGFLVVWSDGRTGVNANIFGTRVSSTGAVLDNLGISIAEGTVALDNPGVAFSGGSYVVVWDNTTSVQAATVSTGGAVASLGTIGTGIEPSIAARSGDALAVWQNGGDIAGARYNGTAFSAVSIATGAAAASPAVGASSGDYLVTWTEGATAPDLRGRFVTGAGAAGTPFDISLGAGGQNDSTVGNDGTNFVVAWVNNSAGNDIYGTRVTPAGAVLDFHTEGTLQVGGAVISDATGAQIQPAIACNSGQCLATWSDRRTFATTVNDVFGQRIDGSFAMVGANFAIAALPEEQRNPAVVAVGGDYRASWHDRRHGGIDTIFTARVNGDGSLPEGSGANIVSGNNSESRPAARRASGASDYWLVAWGDSRGLGRDIYGGRFGGGGAKLDASALPIAVADGAQANPAIAWDGAAFLMTWSDSRNGTTRDIFGARVAPSGSVLGGNFQINASANDQRFPAVAFGAGSSLVVWEDERSGNSDIFGALVDTAGNVTLNDISICSAPAAQTLPAVTYDDTSGVYVVTWASGTQGEEDIFAAVVTGAGGVPVSCGTNLSGGANGHTQARVASGSGGGSLVTWTDPGFDIVGKRVDTAGGTLTIVDASPIGIATGAPNQSQSDVTFIANGGVYVVAWTDDRDAGVSGNDIWGQVILATGQLDGTNFVISANPEDEGFVSITSGATGKPAMAAYERARPDLDTVRVGTRRLTFEGSTGSTCSMDAQCTSGFCVDGRCCDQACGGNDLGDCQACSVSKGSGQDGLCQIILNTNKVCRPYADTFCDRREKCDGVNAACPDDVGKNMGRVCTTSGGTPGACPADDATGAPHVCQ